MSRTFADLLKEGMARKRRPDGRPWGPYQLQGAIGLLDGDRPFNITQTQRLLSGERRTYTHDLVERLIEVLDLPEDEAWHAAGLWPPDLDVEGYRRFRELASSSRLTARLVESWLRPAPMPSDLTRELVERLRPPADELALRRRQRMVVAA